MTKWPPHHIDQAWGWVDGVGVWVESGVRSKGDRAYTDAALRIWQSKRNAHRRRPKPRQQAWLHGYSHNIIMMMIIVMKLLGCLEPLSLQWFRLCGIFIKLPIWQLLSACWQSSSKCASVCVWINFKLVFGHEPQRIIGFRHPFIPPAGPRNRFVRVKQTIANWFAEVLSSCLRRRGLTTMPYYTH